MYSCTCITKFQVNFICEYMYWLMYCVQIHVHYNVYVQIHSGAGNVLSEKNRVSGKG